MNNIAATITELRVLIGYLGEKDQANWWGSQFFSATTTAFLAPIFNRSLFLARYQGATAAAAQVHDEAIGVGRIYHLFRLPIGLEQAAAAALNDPAFVLSLQAHLVNQELGMMRLGQFATKQETASPGPVSLGRIGDDLEWALKRAAGMTTSWLFVGLYHVKGYEAVAEPKAHFLYELERVSSCEDLVGRLYASSPYTNRNSYVYGETLETNLVMSQLLPRRLSITDFPGYKLVDIPKAQLDIIVRDNIITWRTALSNVKGIYLISDRMTHKLYVGKADGAEGIWGRWCAYSKNGHGGNVALKEELGLGIVDRQANLRFSLLEIADIHSTKDEILAREEHWKSVLMTRQSGFNRN